MSAPSCSQKTPVVSVVVIGKNEGPRLGRCLASVQAADWTELPFEILYVDSGSCDGSLQVAEALGAAALALNDSQPCAAKARNLGWQHARGEFILFLDGDTELHPAFVRQALSVLEEDTSLCAAWGHRRETQPQQSIYTRVLDLDWVYPSGRSLYFGGDVLVRRAALAQVGGFDGSLAAGEEPELCARLRAVGWQIEHIDTPMTGHDLAVRSWRAYARRCWRSGMAYAEVASRARTMGDALWQRESLRDMLHGLGWIALPFLVLALAVLAGPAWALAPMLLAALMLLRSAWRARWKATGQPGLLLAYAVHSQVQKIPALGGQLAWRWAYLRGRNARLADYKELASGESAPPSGHPKKSKENMKALLAGLLSSATWASTQLERGQRLWAFARLQRDLGHRLDASNVILGRVEVEGTRRITMGAGALIHAGVLLETQGQGRIDIGDRVVLSRGVHIVAFDHVRLGDDVMIGEYTSIRDANHRASDQRMRESGHDAAAISLGRNVWVGRGAVVLKGVQIGDSAIVGANAVVTRNLPAGARARGVPARQFQTAAA